MGISIHYSGRIADKHLLPQLIEEVQEIATVQAWKYTVYEREFTSCNENDPLSDALTEENHDGKLYGIDFTPDGSETVALCFLSNGRMSSIMQLALWGSFDEESVIVTETEEWAENDIHSSSTEEIILDQAEYNRLLCTCSVKTQFTGPQVHELIIGILRYLSVNFLTDFQLTDESEFWETGDKGLLQKNFERNSFLIDSFADRLNNEQRLPDEDTESFIKRIIGGMRNKEKTDDT